MDYSTIAVLGSFVGMLIGIFTITRNFRKDMDDTISKMFKRFDDHKESVDKKLFLLQDISDKKYVRQDLCALQSTVFKELFSEINKKLDLLLEERRNNDHSH